MGHFTLSLYCPICFTDPEKVQRLVVNQVLNFILILINDSLNFFLLPTFSNALKCYSRARDYCVSAKQVVNMCVNVIKVGVCNNGTVTVSLCTCINNYYYMASVSG